MVAGNVVALAAALAMCVRFGGDADPESVIWVELCGTAHPGVSIPMPIQPEKDGSPANACHAACGVLANRRLGSGPSRGG